MRPRPVGAAGADVAERLSPSARTLLAAVLLVAMASSLTGAFVQLFLYVSTGQMVAMAQYNLALYAGIGLTSVWAATQHRGVRARELFSAGVGLTASVYALFLLLGRAAAAWALPLGGLYGVAAGVYWFSVNVLVYDLVGPRERNLYFGTNLALQAVAGVVFPAVGGEVIDLLHHTLGYSAVFAAAVALYLTAWAVSRRLPPGLPVGGQPGGDALRLLREHPGWPRIFLAIALRGVRDVTAGFVTVALVYWVVRSAGGLGGVTALSALAGATGSLAVRRLSARRQGMAIWLGAVGVVAAAALLFLPLSPWVILAFAAASGGFAPVYTIPVAARILEVMDEDPQAPVRRGAYVLSRELAVNLARVLAILGVWLALGYSALPQLLVGAVGVGALLQLGVAWAAVPRRGTRSAASLSG